MASESTVAPKGGTTASASSEPSSFGNDLPTYRAISALALASAMAGLLAGLSFISWYWLIPAALAVVTGVWADYRIRKLPDILTGRTFAHAGIAMGLIFGVTSVAYSLWTTRVLKAQAMEFAGGFVDELNKAGATRPIKTGAAMWYMIPPGDNRRQVGSDEAEAKVAEMLKSSDKVKMINMTIKQMIDHAGPGNPISIIEAEKLDLRDNEVAVSVLLKVGNGRPRPADSVPASTAKTDDRPKEKAEDHDHAKGDGHDHDHEPAGAPSSRIDPIMGDGSRERALVVVQGIETERKMHWFVVRIDYPYQPKSFTPVVEKQSKDDGHGHDH